jgi:hypothetical protein
LSFEKEAELLFENPLSMEYAFLGFTCCCLNE